MARRFVPTRLVLAAAALAALAGCTPSYSPNNYNAAAVQKANQTMQGIIVGVRKVDVTASGATGALVGGAAGGIAGAQAGTGSTAAFGALGGSVVGGLLGIGVERAAGDTTAYEYVVRETNGQLVSVTQKDKTPLEIGEHVLVISGEQARVVRDYTVPLSPAFAVRESTVPPPAPVKQAPLTPPGGAPVAAGAVAGAVAGAAAGAASTPAAAVPATTTIPPAVISTPAGTKAADVVKAIPEMTNAASATSGPAVPASVIPTAPGAKAADVIKSIPEVTNPAAAAPAANASEIPASVLPSTTGNAATAVVSALPQAAGVTQDSGTPAPLVSKGSIPVPVVLPDASGGGTGSASGSASTPATSP